MYNKVKNKTHLIFALRASYSTTTNPWIGLNMPRTSIGHRVKNGREILLVQKSINQIARIFFCLDSLKVLIWQEKQKELEKRWENAWKLEFADPESFSSNFIETRYFLQTARKYSDTHLFVRYSIGGDKKNPIFTKINSKSPSNVSKKPEKQLKFSEKTRFFETLFWLINSLVQKKLKLIKKHAFGELWYCWRRRLVKTSQYIHRLHETSWGFTKL
jgi:hypothetical protein